jgi:hypothetical protein
MSTTTMRVTEDDAPRRPHTPTNEMNIGVELI